MSLTLDLILLTQINLLGADTLCWGSTASRSVRCRMFTFLHILLPNVSALIITWLFLNIKDNKKFKI